MTKEEKRQVVQNFVKEVSSPSWASPQKFKNADWYPQYLEDNPDAELDSRLMAGLNTMATNLVERTFEDKTSSVSSTLWFVFVSTSSV